MAAHTTNTEHLLYCPHTHIHTHTVFLCTHTVPTAFICVLIRTACSHLNGPFYQLHNSHMCLRKRSFTEALQADSLNISITHRWAWETLPSAEKKDKTSTMQFQKRALATSPLLKRNCLLGRGPSVSRSKERPEALELDANEDANCLDEERSYVSTQKKNKSLPIVLTH